ncbi:septum site-determining protein MinC [Ectothiorhodospira lacustris]|uniref:septum site-determining protein MinC n=1 Tax=Ectothiorhodospira lacustris TaxID=2899127 RepID=UPI001EE9A5CF|nr:septum site-determining protein MinC [Ectothiorhodospira lacustris]MCG5510689.1 septum site-determining protein MinC [Ectothiorhodospira lacustris]MCG5522411.1 septum site-determining protein MinC [Ectothiorhodospira lacustris]
MNAHPSPIQPIELKGRMILVSILRLHDADTHRLNEALDARMREAPELMRDMPLLMDVEHLTDISEEALTQVIEIVRRRGFKLIGLQQGAAAQSIAARTALPLIVLGSKGGELPLRTTQPPQAEAANESPPVAHKDSAPIQALHTASLVVNQPVRSGQQVYARGGDLIVLGTVSAGAELLADGHIHVYGTLRGKALAGVRGLVGAKIFCRRLDAELVSIAGHYRIAEDILDAERGDNRLVTLAGETIDISEI